ncbi:hypothetical protein BDA96_04G306400 [Sorghum bicolor]|uniref:Uncharacterized protein n=1 Tax=Sorghum bicolor TaxID=4558 RepID=A0A921R6B9_SORBI|nr:hypothetical protein BDA96_04G306400 [Sorghum bicolor]
MQACSWIFEGSRLQYLIMRPPGARDEKKLRSSQPPDLRPSASCTVCDRVGILFVLVRKLLVVWQSKVCSSFDSCHSFNQCSLVVVTKMKIVITYSLHPKKNYKSCLL